MNSSNKTPAPEAVAQLLNHESLYMMDGLNSNGERCTAVYSRRQIEDAMNFRASLVDALENAANGFASLARNLTRQADDAKYGAWFKSAARMATDAESSCRANPFPPAAPVGLTQQPAHPYVTAP
jgi:hypothetical protein